MTRYILYRFSRSEIWDSLTGFSIPGLTGLHRGVGQLGSYLEILGKICFHVDSGCWQDLVPSDCGTEVFIFLNWEPLLTPGSLLVSPSMWAPMSQS